MGTRPETAAQRVPHAEESAIAAHLKQILAICGLAFLVCGPVAAVSGAILSAEAAGCVRHETNLRLNDRKPVKARDYYCSTDGARPARFTVQTFRLNTMAMSALISGERVQSLDAVFGKARLYDNAVLREYRTLIDRFGNDDNLAESLIEFTSPSGDEIELSYGGRPQGSKAQTVRVLIPQEADGLAPDFPAHREVLALERGGGIPQGYTRAKRELYWRYMTMADLDGYQAAMKAYNRDVAARLKNYFPYHDGFLDFVGDDIGLLRYMGQRGWPERFITVAGFRIGEGCSDAHWAFRFYPRTPVIDVKVIRNISSTAFDIEGLFGVASRKENLRPQSESRRLWRQRPSSLGTARTTVGPGERLVIATRITFAVSDHQRELFAEATGEVPEMIAYVFGPEVVLKGLKVNGQRVDFKRHAANVLALSTGCECGSCPYVHAWDATERRWRNKGKVIHTARSAAEETVETVTLDGLVTKYRIVEQEAEVAFINTAVLTLELDDGQKLTLVPELPELLAKDGRYVRLFFGKAIELSFDAPEGLDAARVRRSHFTVGGYYRRYSEIIAKSIAREKLSALPRLD